MERNHGGNFINMRRDQWILNTPIPLCLRDQHAAHNTELKVCDLISTRIGNSDKAKIFSIFLPHVTLSMLKILPIAQLDKLLCALEKNGVLSVKSMYRLIY